MSNPVVLIICAVIGATFGARRRFKDTWSIGLGVACGVALAFAIIEHAFWYLFAWLIFVPLLIRRRKLP